LLWHWSHWLGQLLKLWFNFKRKRFKNNNDDDDTWYCLLIIIVPSVLNRISINTIPYTVPNFSIPTSNTVRPRPTFLSFFVFLVTRTNMKRTSERTNIQVDLFNTKLWINWIQIIWKIEFNLSLLTPKLHSIYFLTLEWI